jgi:hypothetical protein
MEMIILTLTLWRPEFNFLPLKCLEKLPTYAICPVNTLLAGYFYFYLDISKTKDCSKSKKLDKSITEMKQVHC